MKRMLYALTAFILGLAVCGETSAQSQATNYPARAVTIVVPYPPGGGTDLIARSIGRAWSGLWGQQVIVENYSGADGFVGTQRVLQAPADGYTILLQINQMLLWKSSMPSARVDVLRDFQLVSEIQHSPLVVVVPSTIPVHSFKELVAWCLVPAQRCTWGSATAHSQLLGKQLWSLAGVSDAVHVPYKGTVPMMTDVLGGHISMGMTSASLLRSKNDKLRFLGVSSRERFPQAPEVPTLAEQGYKVYADTWYGLMVAKATPQPVVAAIAAAVKAAAKDPALIAVINSNGGRPVFSSPEEFTRLVQSEVEYLDPILAKFPLGDR